MSSEDLAKRKSNLSEAKKVLLERRLRGQKSHSEAPSKIERRSEPGPQPLSFTQQRIWFLQQLFPEKHAYNMSEAWRIRGSLNKEALQHAVSRIFQRHETLRTSFVTKDDEPLQIVEEIEDLLIGSRDVSHLPADERIDAAKELMRDQGNFAFDLGRAPLMHVYLIRMDDEDHIFQIVLHHIITDEWSNDIIWRELHEFYDEYSKGTELELPMPQIQYGDFAHWQREQVASGALDGQMRYWQKQLEGDLPLLQLPTDRPRPSEQTLKGGIARASAPAYILQRLKELGKQEGATLFTTLLAAYKLLLFRYSDQRDVLVGVPIANRQRDETKNIIGMFINSAVVRSTLSPEMNFLELLSQVRKSTLGALANQDLPFDLLVQALHPERDLSYNPLFQTMFVFQAESSTRTLPDLQLEPIHIDRGVSKFDLTMFAQEANGQLRSAVEYNDDLYDESTACRILHHWQTLLEAITSNPQAPISSLSIVSPDEQKLLRSWNDTGKSFPDKLIHEQIEAHARQHPQDTAIVSMDSRISYADLVSRANQLANYLIELGASPGMPIGLYVERSANMLVGILGILKSGAAYLPIEPSYPSERVTYMLRDSGASMVVTHSKLTLGLSSTNSEVLILHMDDPTLSTYSPSSPTIPIGFDTPAYVIYTSGSTGAPKGVIVSHRNLVASTFARQAYYQEPVGRFLLLSSFSFDSSVAGIFWTLTSGGTLVLPAPDEEKEVHRLSSIISEEKISHTLGLPTLYRLLLDYSPPGSLDTLQVVIVAGEACPPDLGKEHYARLPHTDLYNEYGPTEAVVWCSVFHVPKESDSSGVPIGRPIANTQLYILDSRQHLLPIGVPGEIYVGGEGVALGYWDNDELTAERFPTLDIEGNGIGARVYRTGDLARWRVDGQIEFLGRVDNQVKVRGYRIELGEIESLLVQHPEVEDAAVILQTGSDNGAGQDHALIAYAVAESSAGVDSRFSSLLKVYLAGLVPDYMVPQHIVLVDALPRTPNGKIDRNRLPALDLDQYRSQRNLIGPRTPAEETLARIWCDILRLPEVSVEDGFFELGGDSIMIIQVVARARQQGIRITVRQVFQEQTIARLVHVSENVLETNEPAILLGGTFPLTPIQCWFFELDLAEPGHWNQAAWFELADDVNLELLQEALDLLLVWHPMLRARFRRLKGNWEQEVFEDYVSPEIEYISLAALRTQDQDDALIKNANRLHAGLNLEGGSLLRAAWFDLGTQRSARLLITIHHLVVDVVSWGIIQQDLKEVYDQLAAGDEPSKPPTSTSYQRWADLLTHYAADEAHQSESEYWLGAAYQETLLPTDGSSHEPITENSSELVTSALDSMHTAQLLGEVHSAYNTRIEDILLTALVRAFDLWYGARKTFLTLERHGREDIDPSLDLSRTVGWFTSLFPILLELPERNEPGADIQSIKEQLRAVPNNGIGFGIFRYLGDASTRESLRAKPEPQILFNYLGVAASDVERTASLRRIISNTGQVYSLQNRRMQFIDINAQVVTDHLTVRWQYPRTLFSRSTIERLANYFTDELAELINHCLSAEKGQYTPSDFPMADLSQEDLDSLSDLLGE